MPAFLERTGRTTYIFRAGPQAVKYGDPYTSSGTVRRLNCFFWRWFGKGVCEIDGYTRREDDPEGAVGIHRDMQDCLYRAGYAWVLWQRRRTDGSWHWVKVKTRLRS